MPKPKTTYICTQCNAQSPIKTGRCANCGAFSSMKEHTTQTNNINVQISTKGINLRTQNPANNEEEQQNKRIPTPNEEINRVLGGGFVAGSLLLLAGEPGVGKSTLALQITAQMQNTLYFSAEESAFQVQNRAKRLGMEAEVFSSPFLKDIITTIQAEKPTLAVVDSVQVVKAGQSVGGTISQQREITEGLLHVAKKTGTIIILIGHVTKSGDLAGPRALEHLVDVVLELRGDRNTELRLLKSPKNRFGSTAEVGVLSLTEKGLNPVQNPAEYFLTQNQSQGIITVQRNGNRNFLLEIQALTITSHFGQPRRTSAGLELNRFHVLLAVLERFTRFGCQKHDAYLNVVGGIKLSERSADLAVMLSVVQSRLKKEIEPVLALGEVGLRGEIRPVSHIVPRIKDALRCGITKIIIPKQKTAVKPIKGIEIIEVSSVADAVKALFGG